MRWRRRWARSRPTSAPVDDPDQRRGVGSVRAVRRHHARVLGPGHRHQLPRHAQHGARGAARDDRAAARTDRVCRVRRGTGRVVVGVDLRRARRERSISFSKSVAREVARYGITVNVVCPGPTDTPLIRAMADELGSGERFVDALTKAIPMRRLATAGRRRSRDRVPRLRRRWLHHRSDVVGQRRADDGLSRGDEHAFRRDGRARSSGPRRPISPARSRRPGSRGCCSPRPDRRRG